MPCDFPHESEAALSDSRPNHFRATEKTEAYVVPSDAIQLRTTDERLLTLAGRLWDRAPAGTGIGHRVPPALAFTIDVTPAGQPPPTPLAERWTVSADALELSVAEALDARIDLVHGRMIARTSARLLADHPSDVARLLLETPAAILLARRGYAVLHAGALIGPAGAVVIRGGAGAGKSTLLAAAYGAGLGILGDDTVLVSRTDPDDLLAAVRDLTLLPDTTRLLGLEGAVTRAGSATEIKYRLDLFAASRPALRRGRRVTTVLLGPWHDGPARLEPLTPTEFSARFGEGEIPQERWSGTPREIAAAWARSGSYRLTGAADLQSAILLLAELVSMPQAASRA